ncbi:LamG domain-containing protein [Pseudarthrobacter sp. MM222]|uniref:LamG domain-containing protein n=1 Tax=Pseudarthrobacter sp. MM222 TaxID=3018929 RepID=UPI00221FD6C9|nr:LamG domain-containing protein [Pseudarthrobacter sp. MM222]
MTIQTSQRRTGTHSAKLHVTDTAGSLANLSTPAFPSGTKTAYADGWFNITTAGVAGNNVPYFRFFSGSTRIADVYRYNSNGQMWLRVTSPSGSFVYTKLTAGSVTMNAWHHVVMRVTPSGSKSTIQVWLDGALKYSSSAVNMNATSLSKVQMGAEHSRQKGDEYIDDVLITTRAS